MTTQTSSITPRDLYSALSSGQGLSPVIDVRSAAEYQAGHIPGAQLIPIEELSAEAVQQHFNHSQLGREETLYLVCHAGPRAAKAAQRLQQAGYHNVKLIEGGTLAWQQAGLPVERSGNAISLERQVQIAIGVLLITKVLLGFSVHELFFAISAVIGAGLILAGTTSWCGMAKLMALMPWNQSRNANEQAMP